MAVTPDGRREAVGDGPTTRQGMTGEIPTHVSAVELEDIDPLSLPISTRLAGAIAEEDSADSEKPRRV